MAKIKDRRKNLKNDTQDFFDRRKIRADRKIIADGNRILFIPQLPDDHNGTEDPGYQCRNGSTGNSHV